MVLVNTDMAGWENALSLLHEKKCLFAACTTIHTNKEADEVTGGKWLTSLVPYHPLMGFTIIADNCPDDVAEAVSSYMWDARLNQAYPILPADMISDFLIISRLVSHKETLYRIESDGRVSIAGNHRFHQEN